MELLEALLAEAEAIWTAPHRRRAAVLGPEEAADARTAAELRAAARELRSLAEADPELLAGGAEEVLEALAALRVRQDAAPGGVLVAAAPAIRARRFRAVFVCGLQDGEFPRRPSPEPFLDDDARASLARASGLVLRRHEDVLGEERHLFYACVSRPEEVLFLSFRSSDEDGDPLQPSPFVADVRALFTDELWRERGTRLLAEVTWPPATAPTPHELRRAQAAAERVPEPAALARPAVGRRARLRWPRAGPRPPAAVETFAACGVRWLSRRCSSPQRAEPDPEPMRRGSLAHAVLEATLRGLQGAHGVGAAGRGHRRRRAGRARARARRGAREPRPRARDRPRQGRRCGRSRRTSCATCATRPRPARGWSREWLEWSFGREGDSHGALALNGSGYSVTGRVDRIDVDGSGRAVVRDYKGKTVHAGARWAQDGRLQAALYALAARELLGLEPAGALYQPIGKGDRRPRGFVRRRHARPLRQRRRRRARGARRRAAGGARGRARRRARDAARAGSARARRAARRTAAPTRASAGAGEQEAVEGA